MRNLGLYALVILGVYLSYQVLSPFLSGLTWAVLFAILFRPIQDALTRRAGASRAALVTTLIVAIVIVAPAVLLVSSIVRQAPQAIASMKVSAQDAPRQFREAWDAVRARSPIAMPEDPSDLMAAAEQRALAYLGPRAGSIVGELFATLGTLAVMLFALFFLLRDGPALSRQLRERLPLDPDENQRLIDETRDLVLASVGAGLAVAAAQGTIGMLAFWILGLGAPVFWGAVIALCSMLPVFGSTLVWVPAGVWLLLSGATGRGIAMLVIGTFGIATIDNILRPLVLSGRTSINGLVVFLGLLGGAAAFGLVGLVIGPIILMITARLLEALRHPVKERLEGESFDPPPGAQVG